MAEPNESNRDEEALDQEDGTPEETVSNNDEGGLVCPPAIDPDVFNSLPPELQQELVLQHQVDTQISESGLDGLDPDVLAALPEEMRREVIEQEQQQQRLRELQASQAADPANAEEYLETNASFLASLSPDLREESELPPPFCLPDLASVCSVAFTSHPMSFLSSSDSRRCVHIFPSFNPDRRGKRFERKGGIATPTTSRRGQCCKCHRLGCSRGQTRRSSQASSATLWCIKRASSAEWQITD